jgi:hypothetical protein
MSNNDQIAEMPVNGERIFTKHLSINAEPAKRNLADEARFTANTITSKTPFQVQNLLFDLAEELSKPKARSIQLLEDEVSRLQKHNEELVKINNEYLERARTAERELENLLPRITALEQIADCGYSEKMASPAPADAGVDTSMMPPEVQDIVRDLEANGFKIGSVQVINLGDLMTGKFPIDHFAGSKFRQ